jgi:hypothetical protein
LQKIWSCVNEWKLKEPENGLAVGSPGFNNPIYFKGLPLDFVATQSVPREGLLEALSDDNTNNSELHPLTQQHGHLEFYIMYLTRRQEKPAIVPDGTHITTSTICISLTSRGSIRLRDADPESASLIYMNYLATETDR